MTGNQHGSGQCPHCAPHRESSSTVAPRHTYAPSASAVDLRMVTIPGGSFQMGNPRRDSYPSDGESPVHEVALDGFAMTPTTVTNQVYGEFVAATGYVSEAERFGWSFVFAGLLPDDFEETRAVQQAPWWRQVFGASWDHPEGPQSDIAGREHHPVIHVSWNDAMAFCQWSDTRLPTEAEWEYAARGGTEGMPFWWGNELTPDGEHRMNVWQGTFPNLNSAEDGFLGTAPADAFTPNPYGLFNMTGNVWEWCLDWFSPTAYATSSPRNPIGPRLGTSRVMRGGSYLCHRSYCNRYRVDARSASTPDSSTGNIGFRVVRSL